MESNIIYRKFVNMDGANLPKVWNSSAYAKIFQLSMDAPGFESHVFAKLYFEPEDLIVAVEQKEKREEKSEFYDRFDGEVVGFVHGGFRPGKDGMEADKSEGCVAMLVVRDRPDQGEIRANLLLEMEKHFASMGIRRVYVGAVYPMAPFYFGLLTGMELNGIQENDPFLPPLLLKNGYVSIKRHHILRLQQNCQVSLSFEQSLQAQPFHFMIPEPKGSCVSPQSAVSAASLPVANVPGNGGSGSPHSASARSARTGKCRTSFWEMCTCAPMESDRYALISRSTRQPVAWVSVLSSEKDKKSKVLGHLYVKEAFRKKGYAKLLLTMVLRHLQIDDSEASINLQIPEENSCAIKTFLGLNFQIVSTGNVYCRDLPEEFVQKWK